MNKISLSQLTTISANLKKLYSHRDIVRFGTSLEVLKILFGKEWTDEVISQQHKNKTSKTKEARDFLRTKELGFQMQERIYRLAERSFNLQNVKNFEGIIEEIKRGNLQSRFAELEAGTHFYRRGIKFEFVKPIMKKGFDFDIILNTNPKINCEVKHKIESTKLSGKTLIKSLEEARKQVPSDKPAFFVIKIPEDWIKHPNFLKEIPPSIEGFFKQKRNSNVIGSLFRWESRHPKHKGGFFWRYKLVKNSFSKFSNKQMDLILKKINSQNIEKWVSF